MTTKSVRSWALILELYCILLYTTETFN